MLKRDYDKISFQGVGLAFIFFGAVAFAFAMVAWALQFMGYDVFVCAYPFFKVIGSAVIIGMGYVILEIELLRKK